MCERNNIFRCLILDASIHDGCTLNCSLVNPYLIYCISVWGLTYQCYLSRIIVLQKKMIRIVSKVSFDSHTDDLFKEHNILKFSHIYFQIIFVILFTLASQIHLHNTRNSSLFYIPHCRTNFQKFSIQFQRS